jgi:hypothetical protein
MTPDLTAFVVAWRGDHPHCAVAQQCDHLVSFDRDFKSLLARHQLTVLKP